MSQDTSLEPLLRAVEPAVRLISERHLRQVLHYLIDREHPLPINLEQPYWVSREDLVAGRVLPEHILAGTEPRLLLATVRDDRLPLAAQLRAYWRVLFRAAVVREIDRSIESGTLREANCLERLEHFGLAGAREIRAVLLAEHLITSDANAALRYRAFAALYLDLASFEPEAVGHYFPSLPAGPAVPQLLAEGLDAERLLAATRPSGADDAIAEPRPEESGTEPAETEQAPSDKPLGLLQAAREAEERGNNARSAILRAQCGMVATGDDRARALSSADAALGKLVDALGGVFNWNEEARQEWRHDLAPLVTKAARGFWPRAARCLYELQKIPADLSRDVFAVDLAESIRTFGRRPVKRPLPHARPVLILMSLKKAQKLMLRSGLRSPARARLDHLFHEQIHSLEHAVRHEFTPIIAGALQTAGLIPVNAVEEVARDKLIAELLDRVCERGYLRIGDLRDAIARNRLKMDDLTGPGEFFRGDALLRADIAMAYALDGVYRKGEFYLRWIQRCISIFFGTSLGRLFTLYIAVPFGGAFMALMFMEELRHIGGKLAHLVSKPVATAKAEPPPTPPATADATPDVIDPDELDIDDDGQVVWVDLKPGTVTSDQVDVDDEGSPFILTTAPGAALVKDVFTSSAPAAPHHEHPPASDLIAWPTILGLGVFLLLMFHVPPFRRTVFALLHRLWWVVRGVLWDVPSAIWHSRTVRGMRQSRAVLFLDHHFWSPFLITFLVIAFLLVIGVKPLLLLRTSTVYFWAILTLAYNTPFGWVVQDRIAETVSDGWRLVRVNLVPGLIGTIIDWFKMLANWVERQLYAVDEWFRFRGGDSAGSLATKAILGLIWFPIAYVFRFVFYLLVEPQVNPVKHFPVVTVSHKVIWPMVPQIAEMTNISVVTVSMFVNGIPGIFGFIAWELKENWRLYRTNRPARLRPVMIGSHGETMRGLLRPGFHSGTVPKLFRKLRHASRPRAFWLHHDLDHAAEGVRRFAEREFILLLDSSKEWGGLKLEVGAVRFGYQRLVIELTVPGLVGDPFVLALENVGGMIEAFVEQVGWADKLTEPRRSLFIAALRGFLDMAAAERIDGLARIESGASVGQGLGDLTNRMTWNEWMARWGSSADGVFSALPAQGSGV